MQERQYWDDYMAAYEDVFNHTSTEWAPWHIIPADHKWFTRLAVAATIYDTMSKLNLAYPVVSPQVKADLAAAKVQLMTEVGGEAAEKEIEEKVAKEEPDEKKGKKDKKKGKK